MGKLGFLYDSEVLSWSRTDLSFSYAVRLVSVSTATTHFYGIKIVAFSQTVFGIALD